MIPRSSYLCNHDFRGMDSCSLLVRSKSWSNLNMDRLSLLSYLSGDALYAGRGATARSQLAICIQRTSGKFEGGRCRCLFLTIAWTCYCFGWWMDMNGTCYKIPAHTWSIPMLRGIWKTFHPQNWGIMALLCVLMRLVFSSHLYWLIAKLHFNFNPPGGSCCSKARGPSLAPLGPATGPQRKH